MQKRKWENSNETKAATEMDQLKEKIKRKRNVFTDQHLLKPQGLQEIKDEFPIYLARKCSLPAVSRFHGLMMHYQEWAHDLFPKLSFPDLLSRTENFGKKQVVRDVIQGWRRQHALSQHDANLPNEEEFAEAFATTAPKQPTASTMDNPPSPLHQSHNKDDSDSEQEFEFNVSAIKKQNHIQDSNAMDSDDESEASTSDMEEIQDVIESMITCIIHG